MGPAGCWSFEGKVPLWTCHNIQTRYRSGTILGCTVNTILDYMVTCTLHHQLVPPTAVEQEDELDWWAGQRVFPPIFMSQNPPIYSPAPPVPTPLNCFTFLLLYQCIPSNCVNVHMSMVIKTQTPEITTVEPPNKGHFGTNHSVHYQEDVLFSEV